MFVSVKEARRESVSGTIRRFSAYMACERHCGDGLVVLYVSMIEAAELKMCANL